MALPFNRLLSAAALACWATSAFSQTMFVGMDAGAPAPVQRYLNGTLNASFFPFPGFTGGVTVAHGDINGDGTADMIVGAASASTHVQIYDGTTGTLFSSFLGFSGATVGVNVASGDINGDGIDDLIVAARTVNSHVKVFRGPDLSLIHSFFAYPGASIGVNVAAADYNGDGIMDLITGADSIAPHVKVFAGPSLTEAAGFLAYPGAALGVTVAGADFNGDGKAEIITAPSTSSSHIKVFDGASLAVIGSFFAFDAVITGGVRVAAGDVNGDHIADLIAASGPGVPITIKTYMGPSVSHMGTSSPYSSSTLGAFVGGYTPKPTATIYGHTPLCNGEAEITVALTGRPPWFLTWSDGVETVSNHFVHHRIVTAAGFYTGIRIRDPNHGFGRIVGSVEVETGVDVVVDSEPSDETIDAGSGATLAVAATPAVTYQWYVVTSQSITAIKGATSDTYETGPLNATTSYLVRVATADCAIDSRVATVFVRPPAPAAVTATAVSSSEVAISWSAVPEAVSYDVYRSSDGGAFLPVETATGTSAAQSGLLADTTYLYRVRAVDITATASRDSVTDAATTTIFTDDPIVAGSTIMKAEHVVQLQTAVNAFRRSAGRLPVAFGAITPAVTPAAATHITDLRGALAEARSALLMAPLALTDSALIPGMVIRSQHIDELRSAVK